MRGMAQHVPIRLADAQDGDERTISSTVLTRIRKDILAGVLAPKAKLRIRDLQERYQVGFTPLREALTRLAAERLVVAEGQRGYWVAPITIEDLANVVRLRQQIDSMALRLAVERGDEAWEAGIVATFHRLGKHQRDDSPGSYNDAWEERHAAFHTALIEGCRSDWLLHLSRQFLGLSTRYRRMSMQRLNLSFAHHMDEHREIMDAALTRQADRACALIERHFSKTAVLVLDTGLFEVPEPASVAAIEMEFLRSELARAQVL
jgi:GntR family carbon starvation induced transcriptional regulator